MRTHRKLLSLILALTLLFTSAITFNAFAEGNDGTITITPPSSLALDAADFSAYKIFDLEVIGEGASAEYVYKLVDTFTGFASYDTDTYDSLRECLSDPILQSNSSAMNTLASALWTYIQANSATITPVGTSELVDGKVIISDLDLGYYLVFGKGVTPTTEEDEEDGVVVTALCALTTADPAAQITLKADAPTLEKEIWNHNIAGDDKWDTWTDLNIGDTALFQLTTAVPVMTGYDRYFFIVHDTMSPGLSFVSTSVVVKLGSQTLTAGTDYTLVTTDDTETFQIVFNPSVFVTYTATTPIIITYSAEVNAAAVIANPGNPNTANLEFSNNPYNTGSGEDKGDTGETPDDTVYVYTFEIDLFKYAGVLTSITPDPEESPSPTPSFITLKDAEFELSLTSGGTPINLVYVEEDTNGVAIYKVADSDVLLANIVTRIKTPVSGKVSILGLDAGTYYLEEKVAPEGYNLLANPLKILVSHVIANDGKALSEGLNYTVSVWDATLNAGAGDYTVTEVVNVLNKAGSEFPSTGGIGRTIFLIGGPVIMGAALICLFVFRKKIFSAK